MHKIVLQISEAAQRAAIVAGGNAAREQTFEIDKGPEYAEMRRRLLALPKKWTSISKEGSALVLVPYVAKVSPQHFAGNPWRNEDWGAFGSSYLDESIDLRAETAPANATEAIEYAERIEGLGWLKAARVARAERLARERAEADEREARERPEREARAAREAERERERAEAERAEAERAQIGALFGPADHPERIRFEAGAMSAEEIENAVETRLTCWLPPLDAETGAFAPLSVDAHRYMVSTLRPEQGRTVGKIATAQEAFGFFKKIEAAGKAWADKAPGRSVELWRAKCDCGQPLADAVVRDGLLEWDGWVSLGEPGPDGHPTVVEDDD